MGLPRILDRLADARRLDLLGDALRSGVKRVLRPGKMKDTLHGLFLGHPLHPALVQLPIGCWVSATVLDLTGASRQADRLIGLGVLGSAPAAAAGLADFADSQEDHRRIGLVHATMNSAALACYVTSLVRRIQGHRAAGVRSALAGLAFVGVSATLGRDLAYRRALGSNHADQARRFGPTDWCDLGPVTDVPAGRPVRRMAGEMPVLVVRQGDEFRVLYERCSHQSGPLSEGMLSTTDGTDCVTCPWHGSVFRLDDGFPIHGPATAPQPHLDTRVRAGRLEVILA